MIQKSPQKETVGRALSPRSEWSRADLPARLREVASNTESLLYSRRKLLTDAAQAIDAQGNLIAALIAALKPFAELADVCDYFGHDDNKRICRFTKDGVPHNGPNAGECRAARDAVELSKTFSAFGVSALSTASLNPSPSSKGGAS